VSRVQQPDAAIIRVARHVVMIVLAAVVGCARAPTATTPDAATPAPVGSPTTTATPIGRITENLVEHSAETRFQVRLGVSDAALAQVMPTGWSAYADVSGAAKDANLHVIFIDRLTVNGPTGQPKGTNGNRLVQLVAPAKDHRGTPAMLVIGGLTEDPADVPGLFGNYLLAGTHKVTRSMSNSGGALIVDAQDWVFEATSGEHLELHVSYDRGSAARGPSSDIGLYSARNPSLYQISREEQVLDTVRSAATPDRVHNPVFTCVGGSPRDYL
jgi:hypothetical protein